VVLHPVALKNSLAAFAQTVPVLLEALLNGAVIAQLLATKTLRIPRTGLLLLRRAEMALGHGKRASGKQEGRGEKDWAHERTSVVAAPTFWTDRWFCQTRATHYVQMTRGSSGHDGALKALARPAPEGPSERRSSP
jgi:hypothetical protein